MGTIFIAGAYGVGKSTLCNSLSKRLGIPAFSASDLIGRVNGENYTKNKSVHNKYDNQDILVTEVSKILRDHPSILLAGHFCIFDKENNVDILPSYVFHRLQIQSILLLEADNSQIISNLTARDNYEYSDTQISSLTSTERAIATEIATSIGCSLYIHKMNFNDSDVEQCLSLLW